MKLYILLVLIALCIARGPGGQGGPGGPGRGPKKCTVGVEDECPNDLDCVAVEGDEGICKKSCASNDDCEHGVCDGSYCGPQTCTSDDECTEEGEVCNMKPDSSEGKCGPPRPDFCKTSDDCEPGFVCEEVEKPEGPVRRWLKRGGQGPKGPKMVCVPARRALKKGGKPKGPACNDDNPCAEGDCMIKDGETDGHCKVPPCESDDDCTDGKTCMMKNDETKGRCKTLCTTGGDECAEGDVCMIKDGVDGFCTHPKPQHCSEEKPCDDGYDCVEAPARRMLKKGGGKGKGPKMICVESAPRRGLGKGHKGPKGEPCTSEDSSACIDNEICMIKEGESNGHCGVPPCQADNECDLENGEVCMIKEGKSEGRCKVPCTAEGNECAEGDVCMVKDGEDDGFCIHPKPPKPQHCSEEKPCDEGFDCVEAPARRMLRKGGGKGHGPKMICVESAPRRVLKKGGKPKGPACDADTPCAEGECMMKEGESEGHCGTPPIACSAGGTECTGDDVCVIKDGEDGFCKKPKPERTTCTAEGNECTGDEVCMIKEGSEGFCKRPRPTECTSDDDCEEGFSCQSTRRALKKGGGNKPEAVCKEDVRRKL